MLHLNPCLLRSRKSQILTKLVKRQWIQKRLTTLNVRQSSRIHHLCMLCFIPCLLRSRKSQILKKLVKRQWIQKRPTTLIVLQGLGLFTYVCFILIHAYWITKVQRFALRTNPHNERFRFLSHNSPRKETRDTSINSSCATSFVFHPLGIYGTEAGAYRRENLQENPIYFEKNREIFLSFLLKNTKENTTELPYLVSYTQIFQKLIVYRFESLWTHNDSQKRRNIQIYEF